MKPAHPRYWLAGLIVIGYMALIAVAMFAEFQEASQRIVDASMGALGAALATAIAGIFRTDRTDEQRAANQGAALDTIQSALQANPPTENQP